MAYLGNQPPLGNFRKIDNIASSFDGSTTVFNLAVSGSAVSPGSQYSMLVVLNGLVKIPSTDYSLNGSTIVFTVAPTFGTTFHAVLYGDTLNSGTPSDGTVTNAKVVQGTLDYDRLSGQATGRILVNSIIFGA